MEVSINQKIWDEILTKDEVIKYEFSVGQKFRKKSLYIWGIVLIPLLVLAIVMFSAGHAIMGSLFALLYVIPFWRFGFYLSRANIYALTNKRVIVRRGWLSATTQTIGFEKITDLAVHQDFLERKIFNTGNILINTAGHMTNQILLKSVENPYEIKKQIEELKY